MTLTLQSSEWQHCLQAQTRNTRPELLTNAKDRTLVFPDWLGTGYKRDIRLQHHLSLTLHRYRLQKDIISLGPAIRRNCFEFSFVIAANVMGTDLGAQQQIWVEGQKAYFLNAALPAHKVYEYAKQDFWAIDVHIPAPLLAAMVTEHEETLPLTLRRMVNGQDDRPALPPLNITPAMQRVLQKIWQCPHQGLTRSLYLEAQALELISLYIQAVQAGPGAPSSLPAADIASIRQAQDILQQSLRTPPSLMELARQVGINDRKLKQGFREVLDTTVFGYLTQQRMETACRLLQQKRSVAVVAATVGYDSPTAFSGAFRRKFGIAPKAYQLANCPKG